MVELELSVMVDAPNPVESLQPLLDQFEAQHGIRVRVTVLPWKNAWSELVRVALYRHGPDVSQIGSTWVSNFVAMHALRPFTQQELAAMGGESAFLPAAWQSGSPSGEADMWAVPWLTDTRILYYRRDLLARAGVDERTAFGSADALEQTLRRLQAGGVSGPWSASTQRATTHIHSVASWMWGAGGDFVSADGKRILFNQKEALAGIRAYFALHRYLPPQARHLSDAQANDLFNQGQAAVMSSGPWEARLLEANTVAPSMATNVGTALVPGTPFVGGSNLVVWGHTRQEQAAVELVRFLTSLEAQIAYTQHIYIPPARLNALTAPHFTDNPLYRVLADALRKGRAFPSIPSWGLLEEELNAAFFRIWSNVSADPDIDLDAVIGEHIEPLAYRLKSALSR
ncbi:MAG TPA: extracellular solute-binding protein [Anaerolineae bacterium]